MSSPTPANEFDKLAVHSLADHSRLAGGVIELAGHREVTATEDILSTSGMKLLGRGARLSGRFYELLLSHKLLKPIENSLSIADTLDVPRLIALCHAEVRRIPALNYILEDQRFLERVLNLLGDLVLPPALAVRLTLMQENRPSMFRHALITSMIVTVTGLREKLTRPALRALALAGMFHNIGELYIDPEILLPNHRLSDEERRNLYAHPVTGYLMLREFSEFPPETAIAVLQHHERLDGSGYPYRLSGNEIGNLSRHLAVAEFAASLLERIGADKRIRLTLWLNRTKYDAKLISLVGAWFGESETREAGCIDEIRLMTRLTRFAAILEGWSRFCSTLTPFDFDAIIYVCQRIESIQRILNESGIDLTRVDETLSLADSGNPALVAELNTLVDEVGWQFGELSREVERKLFIKGWCLRAPKRKGFSEWMAGVQQVL